MPITNQNAIRFNNEQVRGYAMRLLKLAWATRQMGSEWFAQHAATFGGDNASEVVADNAPNDGRPQMTGSDVATVVGKLIEKLGATAVTDADMSVLLKATYYSGPTGE